MWIYYCLFVVLYYTGRNGNVKATYRRFPDEYPNITVCESSMDKYTGDYIMPHSYWKLKAHFPTKCTHISGNLVIRNIYPDPDDPDLSFLENIVEISGFLMFMNNSISSVVLPKLKVIRGESFITQQVNEHESHNISLLYEMHRRLTDSIQPIFTNENTRFMLLPSLQVIQKHSVHFKMPHYFNETWQFNGLPYSIEWSQIFNEIDTQKLIVEPKIITKFKWKCNRECTENSRLDIVTGKCWSDQEGHCQKRSKCIKNAKVCKWCYFKPIKTKNQSNNSTNEYKEIPCEDTCIGGCYGIGSSKCHTCERYINQERCVYSCYDDSKVHVNKFCVKKCPKTLVLQRSHCVGSCGKSEIEVDKICRPCDSKEQCEKNSCKTRPFEKTPDGSSFYLTAPILHKLKDCVSIEGQLKFSPLSFNKHFGNISLNQLYETFKSLKLMKGEILISGEDLIMDLRNLTFFENLNEIRKTGAVSSDSAALYISNLPNLEFIGLKRLRRIYGRVVEKENRKLCYWNTIPWKTHVVELTDDFPNKTVKAHCITKKCDISCQGCWGPTNRMCYNCKHGYVRAGDQCVERCSQAPNFYSTQGTVVESFAPSSLFNKSTRQPYDNGNCSRCNRLCGGSCIGPDLKDCTGPCRYFKENNVCVDKCSWLNYADSSSKECMRCPDWCIQTNQGVCTGNSTQENTLTTDKKGCFKCEAFLLDINNHTVCTKIMNHPGYYSISATIRGRDTFLYKPCQENCGLCTSVNNCILCKMFWSRGKCVKQCPNDVLKPDLKMYNTTLKPNASCIECDPNCYRGCRRPNDASSCFECQRYRIYEKGLTGKFKCVSKCEKPRNYSRPTEHNSRIERICLTLAEKNKLNSEDENRQSKHLLMFILLLFSSSFIVITAAITLLWFWKRRYIHKRKFLMSILYSNIQEPDSKILLLSKSKQNLRPNMNRLLIIQPCDLFFNIHGKKLGHGAFGDVYKGLWRIKHNDDQHNTKYDGVQIDVAIKVISSKSYAELQEIMKEASVMASVTHRYCLRLIGVCHYQGRLCLVTNYMSLGSLDKYLRIHVNDNSISSNQMLVWSEQIANAMFYLEVRGIIHRDLAARNVLLQTDRLVQITDFGLSKVLQGTEENKEVIITTGLVPIRWLAQETLTSGIYSHKTDVWAYGVTLWEIFSYGESPYADIKVAKIPEYIYQGNRLMQPEICSPEVYSVLLNCWNEDPGLRLSFEELMTVFSNYSHHSTFYLNIPNDKSHIERNNSLDDDILLQTLRNIPNRQDSFDYEMRLSMDGTVCTELGPDYNDNWSNKSGKSVRRQISQLSNLSGDLNRSIKTEAENRFPLLQKNSIMSEESREDYLEPIKLSKVDEDYLEPFKSADDSIKR